MHTKHSLYLGWLAAALIAGCSARAGDTEEDTGGDGDGDTNDMNDITVGDGDEVAGDGDAGDGDLSVGDGDGAGTGGTSGGPDCASTSAEATIETEPVDIILVLDNSGSMEDELDAVEENINVNFTNILIDSGVDYNVILLSRHREPVGDDGQSEGEASTSICVTEPLSGNPSCPSSIPVPNARFHQYSDKIESDDSFDRILANMHNSNDDDHNQSTMGWHEWLRPEAKKVFLEMTDDNEDMTVSQFLTSLTAQSSEFGTAETPTFVWHSIIGLAEKEGDPTAAYSPDEPLVTEKCTGNGGDVTTEGLTYQELSKLTGGLRFPICQWTSYDIVFQTIANDVVARSQLSCDFAIPAPPEGRELELDNVAVTHNTPSGSTQFGQVRDPNDCQDGAFYIASDRIWLCPQTCDSVRANTEAGSNVDVNFTCEPQIIVVR